MFSFHLPFENGKERIFWLHFALISTSTFKKFSFFLAFFSDRKFRGKKVSENSEGKGGHDVRATNFITLKNFYHEYKSHDVIKMARVGNPWGEGFL